MQAWEATRLAEPELEEIVTGQGLGELGDEVCGLSSAHGDLGELLSDGSWRVLSGPV